MGSARSPTSNRLLWRLLTMLLIAQATGFFQLTQAKESDFSLEDDIDFGEPRNSHLRGARDLDTKAFIDDELQPVADHSADDSGDSWFTSGVKRVRRELRKLFGSEQSKDGAPAKHKQHKKQRMHEAKTRDEAHRSKNKRGQRLARQQLRLQSKLKNNSELKHNKRATGEDFLEHEGSGVGDEEVLYYRTLITIVEPYVKEYREGITNPVFMKLYRNIETGFTEIFNDHYSDDDDSDFNLRTTLLRVEPTNDLFKIHVIVQLELPSRIHEFKEVLVEHISKFQRLGESGAEIDDRFYFRQVRDANEPLEETNEVIEESGRDLYETENGENGADTNVKQVDDFDKESIEKCLNNPDDLYKCADGTAIQCIELCNSQAHCDDASDEDEVLCQFYWTRIEERGSQSPTVDNNNENTDEYVPEAPPVQTFEECQMDMERSFLCRSSLSIDCLLVCDGIQNCDDGSDEYPDICRKETNQSPVTSRPSVDNSNNIDDDNNNNNIDDNNDNNVHIDVEGSGRGEEVPGINFPNGKPGCRGDTDFVCEQSGVRICDETRCDGRPDCPHGEDEENCSNEVEPEEVCAEYEFKCDGRCLSKNLQCNGALDCADRTDEQNCPTAECQSHEYKCINGGCIDAAKRCDQHIDCPDGDDEGEDCRCASDQFRCRNGDCVPQSALCDKHVHCRDGSDEADCGDAPECAPHQFRCGNGKCINGDLRCNGYTDCSDSSDEENCRNDPPRNESPQLNLKTYPDSQTIKERREVIFRCRDEGPHRAKVKWSRPGGRPLPVGFQDKNGRLEIPNIRLEDTGTYVCEAVGYPRHVPGQQVTVHLTVERYNENVDLPSKACHQTQATCMNGDCIDKSQICDGTPHCSDGSDEHSCSNGRKCQPNQFMCRNSKCVDRVWRCDGENDCGDHSDEESCDPEPSNAPCHYNEFQCRSGHCIPKSFQCDDLPDCIDGSDEVGCMLPVPIRPPPPRKVLSQGEVLSLTCVATGVPVPMIVWRLNWGHVPEKCVSKNNGGTGTLYCPDMQVPDSGAYSCEIINTRGTHFVNPDTLVTVVPRYSEDVCPVGFFNMFARREDECINCFCFGVSNTCKSANLFTYAIQPPITSHQVVLVELSPYSNIAINEAPSSNIISLHHGVQFRASNVPYGSRGMPYLALPPDYLGKQLKSYGGTLKYNVNYVGSGRPTNDADVIITGNGFTLLHRSNTQPNVNSKVAAHFAPGNWKKPDGRIATREEIMMILANVDNILIRLSYIEATEREVELTNIIMDSAGSSDQGLGSASLVEKCSCPTGYVGDSCETCAPDFVRQPGGPWLGRCVPYIPEPCPVGSYGDPRRGTPCRECPCPQTGANNFAHGCQLTPDSDVICNCNEGYTGRRCEYCAQGYQGNPLIPGDSCHKSPDTSCNAEGTFSMHSNGSCVCKTLVEGPRCDTCAPRSFFLNSFTYNGCIECFCSGLNADCNSSSWFRDQISSNFGHTRAPHGFDLVRDYDKVNPTSVSFITAHNALLFTEPNPDTLYWSLPPQFLGNKLSAYGGKLNYTLSYNPSPGGHMSQNSAPDVVIRSGEDLTIIHIRKSKFSPNTPNSYAVPIIESAWQRSDGQVVNREHLIMALSQVDAIYIKATYTTYTKDGSLVHVSLDVGTQTNIGTERAWEVEECRCPPGYIGLSCERCAPGYKRNVEEGLYLGLCEPCDCNGHSSHCDAETGICVNCADNTEGDSCDRCAAGYSGNPTAGTPYDCVLDSLGSPLYSNESSCGNCNSAGTIHCDNRYCTCKENVQGSYCDQCRSGTFGLSARNPNGCQECFCSGHSIQCHSASLYRQQIPVDFFSNPPLLTDDEGNIVSRDNLAFDQASNAYTYTYITYTPKYWSVRGSVLHNQLNAYGGQLLFTLKVDSFGRYEPGNDVILIGNGLKLLWSRPTPEQGSNDFQVPLHEDSNWQRSDRGRAVPATRNDFMTLLSNLEHILIRATPQIPTTRTSILDVILVSAVEHPTADPQPALEVEVCYCPNGYKGNSCEDCAAFHYRDQNGQCQACGCQEDTSDGCHLDHSGYVECHCHPGYTGDRCQNNDEYTPGITTSARPDYDYTTQITVSIAPPEISIIPVGGSLTLSCTGHLTYNNNPVFVSWYKLNGHLPYQSEIDRGVLHLHNLQIADSGIYICHALSNDTSRVFDDKVSITITESTQRSPAQIVNLPPYVTFEEYQPSRIDCDVTGNPAPSVTWTRVDGQMSRVAHTEGTSLIFDTPRKSDEGSYRCRANNNIGTDEKYTQIYVRPSAPQPLPPPRNLVYIEPPSYNGGAGDNVQLTCQPMMVTKLTYRWTKDGYDLPDNVLINNNIIEITDTSSRDSGTYTCIGYDVAGRRNYTADVQVFIEDRHPYPQPPVTGFASPQVKRLADENRIQQGDDFSITCEASGTPYPTIKWTKVHESLGINVYQTGNVLHITNARRDNRGVYLCIAENAHGSDQSSTAIEVEPREPPTVEITPDAPQTYQLGAKGYLYCIANGIPEPTVQWRRVDGKPLSPRYQEQAPGHIIINDIQIDDAGEYECIAENAVGRNTATATLRVVEPPIIQLDPNDSIMRVTEGDEVRVTCTASGFPNPSVRWLKEHEPEATFGAPDAERGYAHNQAYLDIYQAKLSDSHTYKCIAQNEAGIDERVIRLEIVRKRGDIGEDDGDVERNPYRDPYARDRDRERDHPYTYQPQTPYSPPSSMQSTLSTNLGDDVTLTCDLTDPNFLKTRWERVDGRVLPPNAYTDRNSLIISRVEEQNLGEYRCNVYDPHGTVVTQVVRELVLVQLPHITFHPRMPIEVTANTDVKIFCSVTGAQPIKVYWTTDNNRPLPSSVRIDGQYLVFNSITPADAGGYRCIASNVHGNHSETAKVVVRHPDYYQPVQSSQRYDGYEGEDIKLKCDVQDIREPIRGEIRYTWRRDDGRPLPSSAQINNQILQLSAVRKDVAGRYICESYTTSGARSSSSYVDLNIRSRVPAYLPAVTPSPALAAEPTRPRDLSLKLDQQSSVLRAGESTEVECYSSDKSYTEVIWERADGAPLSANVQQIGNRLIISHVTEADAGNYVCKCNTDGGDLYTTSYELAIETSPHELKRPKIVHAQVSSSVQLSCGPDNSHTSYRWTRQYGQIQAGSDLQNPLLSLEDVQSNDAGTYICTVTTADGESIDYPTILVVTGAIPHFHQEPLSYMSFPTLPDSFIKFNFEITFQPRAADGLILFNGQKRGSGDYIALSLHDRFLEFHFDFDGKPWVITAEEPVTLNEWHTVRVNRFRRDGYMQVDDQHPIAFPSLSQIAPLDLIEDLYIGGIPSWDMLPPNAIERQTGFVGCVSRLTLQGTTLELMKDAKHKEGITSCLPCAEQPCANGGICLESQTELAYTCICQQGWTGRNCATMGTQCTPGICGAGHCENTDWGIECLCPLNRTGDQCQYIEHLNEHSLNFKRNSYAAYATPRSSRLNIKFAVRPNSLKDAILLYAAESRLPSGDFMAVVLRDGHVELLINTGARLRPVQVRSLKPLLLNKWTEIEISRRFGEGILRVGDEPEQKAKASGLTRLLYIKTPLYLGGYDRVNIKVNRLVNITNGFDGCMSKLQDAQRPINLIADIKDAANIQNCGEINEISDNELFDRVDDKASANIDNDNDNEQFVQPLDLCAREPCENGGTCSIGVDALAVCSCQIGFTGKHCEEHITISYNASFAGNGYLELNRNQFDDQVEQSYTAASVVFTTTKPNGLLLWWGQEQGVDFTGQDFIALAIVDGYIEYSVRLDGEEVVIRNANKRVDDGRRHIALIKRTDNTALLELDHIFDSGETRPTSKKAIKLLGNVFIGGIPGIAQFTGGRYTHNFNGCILFVEGEAVGQVKLGNAAVNGINVDTCPIQDDGLEGTEPPVV